MAERAGRASPKTWMLEPGAFSGGLGPLGTPWDPLGPDVGWDAQIIQLVQDEQSRIQKLWIEKLDVGFREGLYFEY